ncbi:MAG: hypothetical protein JRF63_15730 [Deltaproteobacteria bacterium]|nr:hypothetical protein [Deltaproteobacteria bacterium]
MSKLPGWIKVLLFVLLLACAGLAATSAYMLSALGDANDELVRLEGQITDLAHPDGATKSAFDKLGDVSQQIAALHKQNEQLTDRVDALTLKLRATGRRLDLFETGDLEDLGIDELVDQKLSDRLAERRQTMAGRKRPSVDKLAAYLGLSAGQQQRITSSIDSAKDDVWEILSTPRGDGRTLVDDLSETLNAPLAPAVKKKQLMSKLFKEGPPDSEDSYFTEIMGIRSGALDDFYGVLTADQQTKFKSMGIDPFGVQTGYSPFRDEVWKAIMGDK